MLFIRKVQLLQHCTLPQNLQDYLGSGFRSCEGLGCNRLANMQRQCPHDRPCKPPLESCVLPFVFFVKHHAVGEEGLLPVPFSDHEGQGCPDEEKVLCHPSERFAQSRGGRKVALVDLVEDNQGKVVGKGIVGGEGRGRFPERSSGGGDGDANRLREEVALVREVRGILRRE